MGAVADEVELHGAVGGQADDGLRRAAAPGPPGGRQLSLRQRPRTDQGDEVDRVREPAGAVEHLRVVVAREVPSGLHRHVGRQAGDHDVLDVPAAPIAHRRPTVAVDLDDDVAHVRELAHLAGDDDGGRAGGHPPASRAGPHLQGAWVVDDEQRGGSGLATVVVGEIEMGEPGQPRPAPALPVVGTAGIGARIGDDGQVRRPDIDGEADHDGTRQGLRPRPPAPRRREPRPGVEGHDQAGVGMPSALSSPMETSKASPVRTRVAHSPSVHPAARSTTTVRSGCRRHDQAASWACVVGDGLSVLGPRRIVGTTAANEPSPPPPPLPCERGQRADGAQGAEHEHEHLLQGDGEHDPTDE